MAILTALLSALSRKLSSLIQAIMGWSVAALFGRLSSPKRLMVSIAMILSVLWPLFVIGVFFPVAATMVIAFIPIKDMLSANLIRVAWIALALTAPIGVGLLVHAVAPAKRRKGLARAVINGYPLALGFAISFVVTVITVPAIKIASAARRWADEHLAVQPKPGRYAQAIDDLRDACSRAGVQAEVRVLPWSMALATRVIKFFARGAVDALIAEEPRMLRAPGLELYLYPGDLLLRGEEHKLTRVRALLGHTMLERDAWLVGSPRAQHLQDELGRLWEALQRHEVPDDATAGLRSRLREIAVEATKPGISYEDWVMVDRMSRRIEGRLEHHRSVLDEAKPERATVEARPLPPLPADASTAQLLQAAFEESRELVKLEVALAKLEAQNQLKKALAAAIGFAVAVVLTIIALTLGAVAIVLAIGGTAGSALAVGAVVLVLAGLTALIGYSLLPKHPLEHSRHHLEDDLHLLKEHLA